MKTIKAFFMVLTCALLFSYNAAGQVVKQTIVVTLDNYDYEPWCPGLGIVNGYYTYEVTMKMSKEGYLERLNFHVGKSELVNDKGDKVIIADSGHDTYGYIWDWFNNANYYNAVYYNSPNIYYSTTDGWLNDYLPPVMPSEGVVVEMSCKVLCKGVIYRIPFHAVIHMNANGEVVVDFIKP